MSSTYYARERIGPKRALTPEKYLLCEDVPVARTGRMLYGPGEIMTENADGEPEPVEVGPDGITYVDRSPEDVFHPDTLASFDGKPIVNNHPDDDVAPHNWRELAAGVVLRPRRGKGIQDDLLLADFLVTNPEEIAAINNGLREVSLGYKAKYEKTGPATYRQHTIIGNHAALVDAGRCGSKCSIGDHISNEELNMTLAERIRAAFTAKDETALNAALKDVPATEGTNIHIHTVDSKTKDCSCGKADCKECHPTKDAVPATTDSIKDAVFGDARFTSMAADVKSIKDAFEKKDDDDEDEDDEKKKTEDEENRKILGSLEEEAPPGTGDRAAKAQDSAFMADSWQEAISLGEVIVPGNGIQVATFDAKADPRKTLDALCKFRRQVLDLAYLQPETHVFMDSVTGGRDYKTYDCGGMRTLFRAVGVHKKSVNNRAQQTADGPVAMSGGGLGARVTAADLNRRNAEYFAKQ